MQLDSASALEARATVADGADAARAGSLLLDLPVPFRRIDGVLHVEAQAHDGIHRWLDNFRYVTICAPRVPDELVDPSISWRPVDDLMARGGLALHELPWGYHPLAHLRHRGPVRALYRQLVPAHGFLCFSNLGWAGAWGEIGAREAARAGRPYAVWVDRVLDEVHPTRGRSGARGVMNALRDRMENRRALAAIRGAALGLFCGRAVHDAYAPISRQPHVAHDIPSNLGAVASPERLADEAVFARCSTLIRQHLADHRADDGPRRDATRGTTRSRAAP